MLHLDLPVDSVGAEFTGQELIEENDETLPDVAVIEVFRAVHVHRLVIPLRSPVPLVGTAQSINVNIGSQSARSALT